MHCESEPVHDLPFFVFTQSEPGVAGFQVVETSLQGVGISIRSRMADVLILLRNFIVIYLLSASSAAC